MSQDKIDNENTLDNAINIKKEKDQRGFKVITFKDFYQTACSLQESSLATNECIWLGVNDANPQIMASKVQEGGTGWVKYPIHEEVLLRTRMHLSRDQVKELIPILQNFIDKGEIY